MGIRYLNCVSGLIVSYSQKSGSMTRRNAIGSTVAGSHKHKVFKNLLNTEVHTMQETKRTG